MSWNGSVQWRGYLLTGGLARDELVVRPYNYNYMIVDMFSFNNNPGLD